MAFRRLFRGTVDWDRLEAVAQELARRYDRPVVRVSFLEADNWLSTPFVVEEEWFVKVITRQNSLVHALFTGARNLGAFSSGTEGFFEYFGTPLQMAEHDLRATERMREIGLNAPEPVEAFEVDGLGVVVMEYLPDFRSFDSLGPGPAGSLARDLVDSLAVMHDHGLVHGDLRAENVLVYTDPAPPVAGDGGETAEPELYFIDATSVRDDRLAAARGYDLACALAVLAPCIGPRATVETAAERFSPEQLLEAREFLDFVNIRPDHDFDAATVKGEIEKRAV